ncbi:cora-domain-containing protein [Lichtheimia corymbifera JMRC:FSU:9682]|uniref:Cora-domain-containing protein n=1 Tax=Lichtheimia corymbifera JMRC:FSU:9682 TaxID=1263082 RepID=A0A068RX12_9FUNG|nr:cora-domain-containing protein [Lichtheimia corymbifera JMRC:FSU:9682]
MEEAYITHDHGKRSTSPSNSEDFVLQMDTHSPETVDHPNHRSKALVSPSSKSTTSDPDVLYPHDNPHPLDNEAIQGDVLRSFLYHQKEDEPEYELQRQYTARLDDLLDGNEKRQSPKIDGPPHHRRYSAYGEQFFEPSKVMRITDRFVFYSADLGSIKNSSLKSLLLSHGESDKPVADLLLETNGWWIDVFAPSNEEMRLLSQIFRIHPLTTEDIQAQESREKCEIFQHYMFISFRSFNHDLHSVDYLEAVNFYIIVFKTGVLTFHFQPLPHPHNVRRRIHQLKDFIHVTPEWINYALIDDITDSFAPLIQHTELEVDSIDDLVLVLSGSEQTDMLRRIGACRKTVMQLLRLLGPKADVVRSLIKRFGDKPNEITNDDRKDARRVQHEVTLYLGDIQDHIITMLQNVNHYDLVLGRAHRNYLGQISIELSQAGNTTNEMINRLTFVATIVVPLNLVAGLFGMNVKVPGQDYKDLVWFYWIVLGMFMYVVSMVAFGKRFGFI